MGQEERFKGFAETPREYDHNEISAICREVYLTRSGMGPTIYDFSAEKHGKTTTAKELREEFEALLKQKEGK
jgi:hypothetical protein